MAKPGPKPKVGTARRKLVALRVTPIEYAEWKRAAGKQRLSDWIRDQCNKATK